MAQCLLVKGRYGLLRAATSVLRHLSTIVCLKCLKKQSQQKHICLLLVVCQWWLISLLLIEPLIGSGTVSYHCVHRWRVFANPVIYVFS